jgi:enamine deaminase RidA (YjgF/YER057c/UK114 family)
MSDENIDVEARIKQIGLVLPEPMNMKLPFPWVRVHGNRAYVSGHGPQNADGSLAEPLGKVGKDLTVDQAYRQARTVGLSILGSLKRELGDLNRVSHWLRIFGMVNSAPGFNQQPQVINGFTDLIHELWGHERGAHSRSAVGMAELPFDIPVEIEAEIEITS